MYDAIPYDSYDRVIAVGGGAIMDLCKLLGCKRPDTVHNLYFKRFPVVHEKDVIAIPTTCGTGSEVTNISIINRTCLGIKVGLVHDSLYARHAVLVPELLEKLPYPVFATSSLDALVHAVESYLSTAASPFTRMFSAEAIRLILAGYTDVALHGRDSLRPRLGDFLLASTYAGLAFGTAGCATVHAMSYPLGSTFHIPHGESNYAVFAGVLRHYEQQQVPGLADLQELLGRELGCPASDAMDSLDALLQKILPLKRLSAYGMEPSQAQPFAEAVLRTQQRLLAHSPKEMTVADMSGIYTALL